MLWTIWDHGAERPGASLVSTGRGCRHGVEIQNVGWETQAKGEAGVGSAGRKEWMNQRTRAEQEIE